MKLLVGLGNPGEKYKNNRHNAGFMIIDHLISQNKKAPLIRQLTDKHQKLPLSILYHLSAELILAKPQIFMNQSGIAINKIIKNYKLRIKNLIIAHDDLDIPLGKFKIQKGVGPKLHNGLASIEQHLKTKDFWRIRIGIDNRQPEKYINGEKYVLQNFTFEEKQTLFNDTFLEIFTQLKSLDI